MQRIFKTTALGWQELALIAVAAVGLFLVIETRKLVGRLS